MPQTNGERIRELRRATGEKVGAFALRIGISRSHLINIERGARSGSVELLHRIAAVLGVEVDELVADDGSHPQPSRPTSPKPPTRPPRSEAVPA